MQTIVSPGSIPGLVAAGCGDQLGEPVLAAGHLRQGKAPSMAAVVTGVALVEILRPRRSKLLPRHFVLALTPTRVVAFKAWGGGDEDGMDYTLHLRPQIAVEFRREDVVLTGLDRGARSVGGVLEIAGERVPVFRPNLVGGGDRDTDALLAVLGGLPAPVQSAA